MAVTLPTVGGDNNAWGTILNTALTQHDTDISGKAASSHGNHFIVSTTQPTGVPDGTVWINPA